MWINNNEIQEGLQEYFDHKNTKTDPERGFKIWGPTLFDIEETLKEETENFEDNNPLDEEWNICIGRLRDFKTGKIKNDMFKKLTNYNIGDKTYTTIIVPWSNRTFVVDFKNKKGFPWLGKWIKKYVSCIDSFWDREIIIFGWFDDFKCIDSTWKRIGKTCVNIEKIKYWNIDILEFKSRINPDYEANDLRTKKEYFGSDWKWYEPKTQEIDNVWVMTFQEIWNMIKNIVSIDI